MSIWEVVAHDFEDQKDLHDLDTAVVSLGAFKTKEEAEKSTPKLYCNYFVSCYMDNNLENVDDDMLEMCMKIFADEDVSSSWKYDEFYLTQNADTIYAEMYAKVREVKMVNGSDIKPTFELPKKEEPEEEEEDELEISIMNGKRSVNKINVKKARSEPNVEALKSDSVMYIAVETRNDQQDFKIVANFHTEGMIRKQLPNMYCNFVLDTYYPPGMRTPLICDKKWMGAVWNNDEETVEKMWKSARVFKPREEKDVYVRVLEVPLSKDI
jgi:hypothetical protein